MKTFRPKLRPKTPHTLKSFSAHKGAALVLITALLWASSSCGKNVVEKYAPANSQEKAELDMESNDYAAAAEKLTSVLQTDPDNHSARSLLAAAYAAQAGITTLGLLKDATSAAASGQTGIKAITAVLPLVTVDSLDFMAKACDAMAAIPSADRSTEMKLQYSLFFSTYALLQIKYFTDNPDALATLSIEDAAKLLLTLAKATEAGGSSPLSTAVAAVASTLEQAPGSQVDKVKALIATNSSGSGG